MTFQKFLDYSFDFMKRKITKNPLQQIKKTAIEIMKNRQLDSEIRIKAYLAVIDCPCGQSANEIKNLLDTEPVHQGRN